MFSISSVERPSQAVHQLRRPLAASPNNSMQNSNQISHILQRCFMAIRPLNRLAMASLLSITTFAAGRADENGLTVPVRILSAPAPEPAMVPGMIVRKEVPLATVAARMPQYQLHHQDLGDPGDPASPRIRFVLALPENPLLIEAAIFIDGKPFRQAREERVQKIMRYVADPVAFNAEVATQESKSEEAFEPAVPATPQYAAPATIYERIDRYTSATGAAPNVDEVRWLLTNWVDGPVLLLVHDNFQRFRAGQQPVFKVLDRDRDGIVSKDELTKAVAAFQECDLNRDDIVDATELAQAANDVRDQPTASTGKLVFRLPNGANATAFLQRLATHYAAPDAKSPTLPQFDLNSDGALAAEELKQLQKRPADIRLKLELITGQQEASRLTIEGFSDELAGLKDAVKKNPSSLTLALPSFNLEFLAAQGTSSDQISIGAVNDGYAMLQEIDPNADGQFSIRELRQLNERLAVFDQNSDGQIGANETRPTFRVCIGLGPTAHQPLALLREVNSQDLAAQETGPDWFTEMDKNKDNDLTRQEFPGTDEQFKELDGDGDELISSTEANKRPKDEMK